MKINFPYIFSSLAILSFVLISCSREYPDRVCESPYNVNCGVDSLGINVRLVNRAGYPLCDVEIIYETTTGDVIKYGRMDIDEESCYSVYKSPKLFPYISFNLGTEHYEIADSLKDPNKPYLTKFIDGPGFYTFFISISDSLTSATSQTILARDF
ncbi:MAG TPA: hypothetical protein DCX54_05945 [Flavobacteriales bacterium]|nr:hypothetical protein [Flavobacteriales bacterium]